LFISQSDRAIEDPVAVHGVNLRKRVAGVDGRRRGAGMADDARDGDEYEVGCPEHAGQFSHGVHGA
jgi:hypothetical protein